MEKYPRESQSFLFVVHRQPFAKNERLFLVHFGGNQRDDNKLL